MPLVRLMVKYPVGLNVRLYKMIAILIEIGFLEILKQQLSCMNFEYENIFLNDNIVLVKIEFKNKDFINFEHIISYLNSRMIIHLTDIKKVYLTESMFQFVQGF